MRGDSVTVYQQDGGEWTWKRINQDNDPVDFSGFVYDDRAHAVKCARRLNPGIAIFVEGIEDVESDED